MVQEELALQPQETILGLYGEYVGEASEVWSGGLVRLLGELGFSDGAARVALHRLVARGLLERRRSGRLVSYFGTERLGGLLEEARRQAFWHREPPGDWDGTWTIACLRPPVAKRLEGRRLARRLGFRGFAPVRDGTWIAPYDRSREIAALIEDLSLADWAFALAGPAPGRRSAEAILGAAWDLDSLAERYERFAAEFGRRPRRELSRLGGRQAFAVRTRALEIFRQLAPLDPRLPGERLGRDWPRGRAIAALERIDATLTGPAGAHFAGAVRIGEAA